MIVERLSNHLHLVLIPDATVPTPVAALAFRAGSRYETAGTAGFGRWWTESALQGTPAAPSHRVLVETADNANAELTHSCDDELCALILTGPGAIRAEGHQVLRDLAEKPLHRSADAIRKKLMAEWSADQALENRFRERIFGEHPLGHGPATRVEALRTANVADLNTYAAEWIHPENSVLVCLCPAGEADFLKPELTRLWEGWAPQAEQEPPALAPASEAQLLANTRPVLPPSDPGAPYFFPSLRKGPILEHLADETHSLTEFRVGFMGDGYGSKEALTQGVLLELLAGPHGRLRFKLDEHPDGLIQLETCIRSYSDISWLEIRGSCPPASLRIVLRDLYREIFRTKRVPFSSREIERAVRSVSSRILETSTQPVARILSETRVHLLGARPPSLGIEVRADALTQAASTLLVEDRMALFLLGKVPRVDQGDIIQLVHGTLA